jgi:PAS domain S-box-containing protein
MMMKLASQRSFSRRGDFESLDLPRPHILIVDDRLEDLIAAVKILRKLDAEVTAATSGEAAIAHCLRQHISLILIDVKMRTIDGFQTAELLSLNNKTSKIPIIMLSAISIDANQIFSGYQAGAVDYLVKPVSPEILLSKVKVFLELDIQRQRLSRLADNFRQLHFRNELILDTAAMGILGIDGAGCINFLNPKALRLLGGSEELIGTSLMPLIDGPEGKIESWAKHALRRSCVEHVTVHSADTFMYQVDGRPFTAEYTFSPMPAEIGVAGGVLTFQNISQRKQAEEGWRKSEEAFRAMLESSLDSIMLINELGEIVLANKQLERLSGYSQNELIGQKAAKLAAPHLLEKYGRAFGSYLKSPQLTQGFRVGKELDLYLLRKDGQEISVEISVNPMRNEDSIVACVVILDRTEQNIASEVLRRSQRMDAIGEFTGGVAHDFNNILAIILGNTEMLEFSEIADEIVRGRVAVIKKAAERAADLTKQLLRFSNRQAAKAVVTNVNNAFETMDHLVTGALTPKVTLNLSLCENVWLTNIDPGDFQDALLNLILNARDAMPDGGQLHLETANVYLEKEFCQQSTGVEPGEYVQVSVSDTGCGIPAEVMPFVFEPFFSTKDEIKGTGLGLSMVYGFTQRSAGHIKISSTPGVGTTVCLFLPRTLEEQVNGGGIINLGQVIDPLPRGYETILIVDDEEALLELTRASLESLGYRILIARSGAEALQKLATDRTIALLFSDVVMPGGINGYRLASLAMTSYPKIRVLLTTGFNNQALPSGYFAEVGAAILQKPYSHTQLAVIIREQLDQHPQDAPNP